MTLLAGPDEDNLKEADKVRLLLIHMHSFMYVVYVTYTCTS